MNVYTHPAPKEWAALCARPTATYEDLVPLVRQIFDDVARDGNRALEHYTQKFDGVELNEIAVQPDAFAAAEARVPKDLKAAISLAKDNITRFHQAQTTERVQVETQPGVWCWQEKRPIQKVGLYIPGGSAPLFSTILMLAVPAVLAGCNEIVLCSPPNSEGQLPDVVLYTAALCGIKKVYKVGGVQAIAAMTLGTTQIPKVYKLFGPGNQYVTVAKQWATRYQTAIDMPAGPSELLVVADRSVPPAYVAADLLSQAEHGPDSQVILVTTDAACVPPIQQAIDEQLENLPRKDVAKKAIENSKIIVFESDAEAIDFINQYGPEHYIICSLKEDEYVDNIQNAGSVFIGKYTPESAGDYASGTNHTLPTNGYAKQYSGVNLDSFLKQMTFQKIDAQGMKTIGPAIELMADAEGLQAHKNAVTVRLNDLV